MVTNNDLKAIRYVMSLASYKIISRKRNELERNIVSVVRMTQDQAYRNEELERLKRMWHEIEATPEEIDREVEKILKHY